MTSKQFYDLDEMEQAETVWEGLQIADRYQDEYHVILYQIDNLYVEAFYHTTHNFIRKFEALNVELLDIYLERLR